MRYLLIDKTGAVVNAIEAEPSYIPDAGYSVVRSDRADMGWKWDGVMLRSPDGKTATAPMPVKTGAAAMEVL